MIMWSYDRYYNRNQHQDDYNNPRCRRKAHACPAWAAPHLPATCLPRIASCLHKTLSTITPCLPTNHLIIPLLLIKSLPTMPPHLPIRPQSSPTPTQLEVPQQNIEPLHDIHLRRGNSSRVLPTSAIHPSKGEIRLKRTKLKKTSQVWHRLCWSVQIRTSWRWLRAAKTESK